MLISANTEYHNLIGNTALTTAAQVYKSSPLMIPKKSSKLVLPHKTSTLTTIPHKNKTETQFLVSSAKLTALDLVDLRQVHVKYRHYAI